MQVSQMTAEVFTSLPRSFRRDTHSAWSEARGSGPLHSFLEGPSFDRLGNLYCTDVCHGRIFRIDKRGHWELFADYGGQPNGLKIHQDGRIFVADAQYGILIFDPSTGERTSTWKGPEASLFQGVNDLYLLTRVPAVWPTHRGVFWFNDKVVALNQSQTSYRFQRSCPMMWCKSTARTG